MHSDRLAALTWLVVSVPIGILRAWVVQHLWVWFVTPTFDVPAPQIAVIYGLVWFVGLLWPTQIPDDSHEPGTLAVFSVLMSLFGLLVGWIAQGVV